MPLYRMNTHVQYLRRFCFLFLDFIPFASPDMLHTKITSIHQAHIIAKFCVDLSETVSEANCKKKSSQPFSMILMHAKSKM